MNYGKAKKKIYEFVVLKKIDSSRDHFLVRILFSRTNANKINTKDKSKEIEFNTRSFF